MQKRIHSQNLQQALQDRGWSQKDLAAEMGLSAQAVTNWIKGADFPRPDKLLKLATTLRLSFTDLVITPSKDQPVIAFRKKGGAKTTDAHALKAMAMGTLLKPLVQFLPEPRSLRAQIPSPSLQYDALQVVVAEVRARIGLGVQAVLSYEHLIGEFGCNGAVIVPVLWGEKKNHKNALHILLPQDQVTFIFLNLDTRLEDFKFWMAHELAHVYTPDLAGQNEGEDFADAFAGALLFPKALAKAAYHQAAGQRDAMGEIRELQREASAHSISLYSVFCEINNYAKAEGLALLRCKDSEIHAIRNNQRGKLVSEILFDPTPPEPAAYMAAAQNVFRSAFFPSLRRMVKSKGTGPGYIQQIMDIPMQDAAALHGDLSR
ncbi:MAG: XRE family transcriptional regulator [Thiomonas sp.]|uniref:XRE family transcriptional regulator n=1 Tax=Thiomonas sp. X19 TaxID=1050370 RepID=UPI000B66C5D9|nr:XRE family transcriptional regulator [Thiomonas sp. X19]SCC94673.1 Transcriptional regulator, XRE family [Thiomonas sp. X19]